MYKRTLLVFVTCWTLAAVDAATIVEDFSVDPLSSGNGWAVIQSGYMMLDTVAGTLNVNSMGLGSVSPQYYEAAPPAATEQWACAEMIVTVYASEPATSEFAAIGASVAVSNHNWQYLMGVRTLDLGGGIYQTKVSVFDGFGFYLWNLGEYTLSDAGIHQHRYNAELNMANGQLKIYVDGYGPVLTVTAGTGGSIMTRFGDNRGGGSAYYLGLNPNANAAFDRVVFGTAPTTLASEPNPHNGAEDVALNAVLRWLPADVADSHDVYLGTNFDEVNDTQRLAGDADGDGQVDFFDIAILAQWWLDDPLDSTPYTDLNDDGNIDLTDFSIIAGDWRNIADEVFKGNYPREHNAFDPGKLESDTIYYWRIDEIDSAQTFKGPVWTFKTFSSEDPPNIASRRELFVDHYLIAQLNSTELRLHYPQSAGVALEMNEPWEGVFSIYSTVLKDGDLYRMYYRGDPGDGFTQACYAESVDGINWTKPGLGIFYMYGTWQNNIVWAGPGISMSPFIDTNPAAPPSQRYKAFTSRGTHGLMALVSANGINWSLLSPNPVITQGAPGTEPTFDSQNVPFWSESEGRYVCYIRDWVDGIRRMSRTTSLDFINWQTPVLMTYSQGPYEQMYTNGTFPYYRAPHIYIATAARFMEYRSVLSSTQCSNLNVVADYCGDCSGGVLMSTRGNSVYDRTFLESFVRPGTGYSNWVSRTNYPGLGIVQTSPAEMSMFVHRNYAQSTNYIERMTLRIDGYVSVNAGYNGGEMITIPFKFVGNKLDINYAASEAGSIFVEIQDVDGIAINGFTLSDADEIIGDEISRIVTWRNGQNNVSALQGQVIRLRFVMKDADLYSLQFIP